jgi:hypothetical protein
MSQNNIPSKEDFLRAKAAREKDYHGLSQVREKVLTRFRRKGVHEFMLLYSRKTDTFGAYIFYERESQIGEAVETGLAAEIERVVYEELENAGRGSRESIIANFEFDSHENVLRNYEGDYYSRLR